MITKNKTHLNRNRTPNLNDKGLVKVKPYSTHKSGCNGLKRASTLKPRGIGLSHKGITSLIALVVLGLISIGFVSYMIYQSNQEKNQKKGLSQDEVNALIEKAKISRIEEPPTKSVPDVVTNSKTNSNPTLPPSQLTPPPATQVVCREPSGVFTALYFRQRNFITCGLFGGDTCKAVVVGTFRYQGDCPADVYIEAGIPNAPQSGVALALEPYGYYSATRGTPSACDGNTHFNGAVFKQVVPNQVVTFRLIPENYGAEGTYPIKVGAYTGCLKDGGITMQELSPKLVGFSNNYIRGTGELNRDIDYSWIQII